MQITPCRTLISDRFPVASFVVQVPPQRMFEIACATDPRLFHPEQKRHRNPQNFFSSRMGGLMRAPAGHATYLVPSEALRRFAGSSRLYYALGSYRTPRGDDASFSFSPLSPEQAPAIQLSRDFTGRTLDRARVTKPGNEARYGSPAVLEWGGDGVKAPRLGGDDDSYDDGFGPMMDEAFCEPHEPHGYEDAPDLMRRDASFSSAQSDDAVESEPEGYEDAPAIGRAHAPAMAARYGRRAQGAPITWGASRSKARQAAPVRQSPLFRQSAPARQPAPSRQTQPARARYGHRHVGVGRDVAFCEDEPSGGGGGASDDTPLGIPEKLHIINIVAQGDSGADGYGALSADREFNDPQHPFYQKRHMGLAWGLIQFTQASGALGRVLTACSRRDPARFDTTFGPDAAELLAVTNAETEDERLVPVAGAPLWQEPWLSRFKAAAQVPDFQYAQNQVAVEMYFDPNCQFAGWIGFETDRALAMLYDRMIHMGTYGGRRFILDAISPLHSADDRARSLSALGFADLASFQRSIDGLDADGRWNVMTHAAMLDGLCRLGPASPCPLPGLPKMLDALVTAAAGTSFADRVKALRESHDLTDVRYQVC